MASSGNLITGESWHDYFARLRREGVIGSAHDEPDDDGDGDGRVFISKAHVVQVTDCPTPIKRACSLATKKDWTISGPWLAESVIPGTVYKSGEKEGQRRPDKHVGQYWFDMISPGKSYVIRVSCEVVNGTSRPAVRRYWQRGGVANLPISDATMKGIVNSD